MTKLSGWRVVSPAYGRDYKNAKEARLDFIQGKDFILHPEGRYCSIEDFEPTATIEIRYNKMRKLTTVKGKEVI